MKNPFKKEMPPEIEFRVVYAAVHPNFPHLIGYGETTEEAYKNLIAILEATNNAS